MPSCLLYIIFFHILRKFTRRSLFTYCSEIGWININVNSGNTLFWAGVWLSHIRVWLNLNFHWKISRSLTKATWNLIIYFYTWLNVDHSCGLESFFFSFLFGFNWFLFWVAEFLWSATFVLLYPKSIIMPYL